MSEPTAYGQTGSPAGEPVCPRHPDRVSYVRCQRCGRPTCAECQRPAAVGIQCVDCVREGQQSMRQGRTVFGGSMAGVGGRPMVTVSIIAICVVVYLLQMTRPGFTAQVAFVPYLGDTEPWRFLTSAFAHSPGSILHILFNMYALWIMGGYLEPMLGRARFAALYLISALGGSVGYLLLAFPATLEEARMGDLGTWGTPAVGASGAVFGLFGAFLVLQRRLGRSAATMYATIAINAVIGFVIPGIAWQAHLGGFLTGLACAAVLAYAGRRGSGDGTQRANFGAHWLGLAGITVLLVVLAVVKYAVTVSPI
ncbi:membrane associated rhomboid family serine protease [Knoellia remsis]|uniref:Membrane associated rhomboid family serine protease n=1 Tax=Knoellia remsis TaxID=407159 RepID=A0A2T0U3J7_9MICO|nr:rhomboid family intramembrane serine protease [Knoellia remsis]PRY52486.1 membrane associated rhomboid family serine protease [Knoellia remsis]